MKNYYIPILLLLMSGRTAAQEAAANASASEATPPVFQILSESTVQQSNGSSVTFRKVAPPVVTPQALPVKAADEATAMSQLPMKESKLLSISASVKANGFTVLRWTCGESQRLQAVSNVDFRYLEGLGSMETTQASYVLILSTGPDEQAMTDAEARAAQSLPANGRASFALLSGSTAASPADASALDAIDSLLDYFASHREELIQSKAQRESDRAARELAARNAPPPPPRHSVIHFWPLQPAQRAAILENTRHEKGAQQ